MKSSKSSGIFRPFENLKALLESRSFPLIPSPVDSYKDNVEVNQEPENDQRLFHKAMADVNPISRDKSFEKSAVTSMSVNSGNDSEHETLVCLNNLVKYGKGFVVADTPEYIEGTGYQVNPDITKRLHRGDFSIQEHIDLHGLNVENAKKNFEAFLKHAIKSGKRAVLIVHGRGLSSRLEPVLKTKVMEWLTTGPLRKWVIAFSSARLCDGGAGATYVLLRRRPFTKRFRKKQKRQIT